MVRYLYDSYLWFKHDSHVMKIISLWPTFSGTLLNWEFWFTGRRGVTAKVKYQGFFNSETVIRFEIHDSKSALFAQGQFCTQKSDLNFLLGKVFKLMSKVCSRSFVLNKLFRKVVSNNIWAAGILKTFLPLRFFDIRHLSCELKNSKNFFKYPACSRVQN